MAVKTTLRLDETLIKEAKRKALEEDKTLQEVVGEALRNFLGKKVKTRTIGIEELTSRPLKIKGSLKRAGIYNDYLDKKVSFGTNDKLKAVKSILKQRVKIDIPTSELVKMGRKFE